MKKEPDQLVLYFHQAKNHFAKNEERFLLMGGLLEPLRQPIAGKLVLKVL
ncbi:hypothetical protein SDC9_87257 [bioreactor metagenome]|uniref:Uncharacterized protein n=1 Tax=bioreactor metagenome TaxID=1076179 RepID=A0A644ZPK2_9ZZZZ